MNLLQLQIIQYIWGLGSMYAVNLIANYLHAYYGTFTTALASRAGVYQIIRQLWFRGLTKPETETKIGPRKDKEAYYTSEFGNDQRYVRVVLSISLLIKVTVALIPVFVFPMLTRVGRVIDTNVSIPWVDHYDQFLSAYTNNVASRNDVLTQYSNSLALDTQLVVSAAINLFPNPTTLKFKKIDLDVAECYLSDVRLVVDLGLQTYAKGVYKDTILTEGALVGKRYAKMTLTGAHQMQQVYLREEFLTVDPPLIQPTDTFVDTRWVRQITYPITDDGKVLEVVSLTRTDDFFVNDLIEVEDILSDILLPSETHEIPKDFVGTIATSSCRVRHTGTFFCLSTRLHMVELILKKKVIQVLSIVQITLGVKVVAVTDAAKGVTVTIGAAGIRSFERTANITTEYVFGGFTGFVQRLYTKHIFTPNDYTALAADITRGFSRRPSAEYNTCEEGVRVTVAYVIIFLLTFLAFGVAAVYARCRLPDVYTAFVADVITELATEGRVNDLTLCLTADGSHVVCVNGQALLASNVPTKAIRQT